MSPPSHSLGGSTGSRSHHHNDMDVSPTSLDAPLNLSRPRMMPSYMSPRSHCDLPKTSLPKPVVKSESPILASPPPAHSNHSRTTVHNPLPPPPPPGVPSISILKNPFHLAQHAAAQFITNPYTGLPMPPHTFAMAMTSPLTHTTQASPLKSPPLHLSPSPLMLDKVQLQYVCTHTLYFMHEHFSNTCSSFGLNTTFIPVIALGPITCGRLKCGGRAIT
jgi:hypothetical protein